MHIIPVIDLKNGCVVHARHGNRACYEPINSPLCASSSLPAVLNAFLELYAFKTIYLADLNAICHDGNNDALINEMVRNYPHIEFWLDNGCQSADLAEQDCENLTRVIGTESQRSVVTKPGRDFILSLDFKCGRPLGNQQLFDSVELWPQRIIIMNMSKVGSSSGPDMEKMAAYCKANPGKDFIAAGGIRNEADLHQLGAIGISSALVASAFHSGAIDANTIRNLQAKKYPD